MSKSSKKLEFELQKNKDLVSVLEEEINSANSKYEVTRQQLFGAVTDNGQLVEYVRYLEDQTQFLKEKLNFQIKKYQTINVPVQISDTYKIIDNSESESSKHSINEISDQSLLGSLDYRSAGQELLDNAVQMAKKICMCDEISVFTILQV